MSMIERVARALCTQACKHTNSTPDDMLTYTDQGMEGRSVTFPRWQNHTDDARAAIEAMREPTEEMKNAAADAIDPGDETGYGSGWKAEAAWETMIQVALGERKGRP